MSKITFTDKTTDYTTGEVLSERTITRDIKSKPVFLRTYMNDIGALIKCSNAEKNVVLQCFEYLLYNSNEVVLNSERRKEIASKTNTKLSTVHIALSRLAKKNILIKKGTNTYTLNPKLFFFGNDIERNKMLEFKIVYNLNFDKEVDK
jgi:predicted transcriptional regulator